MEKNVTTTNQTPAVLPKQGASLAALLKAPAYVARFNEVLRDAAPEFMSSVLAVGRSLGPDVEPNSIIGSAMIAASLRLPINPSLGFAWVVPYKGRDGKKVAQFQLGYKGVVQLALRTGQYKHLNACEVFEGELSSYNRITGEIVLDPSARKSDKIVGYASYLCLTSGFEHAEYWTIEDVENHANLYSQAYRAAKKYGKKDAPWIANFDEMAKKTVLSLLIRKWGPMSVHTNQAAISDQGVKLDIDAEIQFPDNPRVADEATVPQIEGPAPDAPASQDADQVPGAEVGQPAAESAPAGQPGPSVVIPEGITGKPLLELVEDTLVDSEVGAEQFTEYLRQVGMAKKNQQWNEIAESKLLTVLREWNSRVENIRLVTV